MTRSPLFGIAVALALLAGQVGSALHLAVVEHRRCALHGELIEAARTDDGTDRSDAPSGRPAVDSAGEHHHDHCQLGVVADGFTLSPGPQTDGPPSHAATGTAPPRAVGSTTRLLRLAPKTSPPSAPTSV